MIDFTIGVGLDPAERAAVSALLAERLEETWDERSLAEIASLPHAFVVLARCAVPDDAPVGVALCRVAGGECELLALAVRPDRTRRGIGSALVRASLDRAAAATARRMVLEVADDNGAARRLYDKFGFTAVGRRRRYYRRVDGTRRDAVILARALTPAPGPGDRASV